MRPRCPVGHVRRIARELYERDQSFLEQCDKAYGACETASHELLRTVRDRLGNCRNVQLVHGVGWRGEPEGYASALWTQTYGEWIEAGGTRGRKEGFSPQWLSHTAVVADGTVFDLAVSQFGEDRAIEYPLRRWRVEWKETRFTDP